MAGSAQPSHERGHTAAAPGPATAGLLAVTAVWGSTFFLLKDVLNRIPVADFLAVRFVLCAVLLLVIRPRCLSGLSRRDVYRGLALGALYGVAQVLQTVGLQHTSASVSGFVTGMYVVFTPLCAAVLLGTRVGRTAWGATALATVGLGVLSLHGFSLGPGVLITLASAALYAFHILGLGRWSSPGNAYALTVVQMIAISLICLPAALPGGLVLPQQRGDWLVLAWLAVAAGALALLVQTWAQAHLAPTRAAVIMTMEPVFAGGFAVWLGGETAGWRWAVGGGLVLAAMYLTELGPHGEEEEDVVEDIGSVVHVGPV